MCGIGAADDIDIADVVGISIITGERVFMGMVASRRHRQAPTALIKWGTGWA